MALCILRGGSKVLSGIFTIASKKVFTKTGGVLFTTLVSSSVALLPTSQQASECDISYNRYVKYQTDRIIKSENDKRAYRAIELNNGMILLLISDPSVEKSAVALDLAVGSMTDFRDFPGLAHFCEHMLFLGTEKYPVENEYKKFITMHGGGSNASTSMDHTKYYFNISPEFLEEAIDRFAQFFLTPLFTHGAVEREVEAVNAEHIKNIQNDHRRLYRFYRHISNPLHDYNKFSTGNRTTLWDDPMASGVNIRDELLKFHKQYYSANLMAMCVIGKQSLDELASFVVPLMAEVENKNVPRPEWNEHPYGPEQVGYRYNVVPVKDSPGLIVMFPIPDLRPYYRSQPIYLSHLLGHQGSGSLLSELKNRGWVTSLRATSWSAARGFGFMSVSVSLTDDGLNHVDDIIELIFSYINMLKKEGPQEWSHRECEQLDKVHFRFKDKERPMAFATSLSSALHYYPMEDVLFFPYVMSDYRPDLIEMITKKLSPKNMVVIVTSRNFEGKTGLKERWYGVQYSKEKIGARLLERFEKAKPSEQLHLPEKNDLIPTNFELFKSEKSNGQDFKSSPTPPELLKEDELTRIWYKPDDQFHLPKCCIFLHLRKPIDDSNVLNATLATLYVNLVNDSLTEYIYGAHLAGLSCHIRSTDAGISVTIDGFNEKQQQLLKNLLEGMRNFKPDIKRFDMFKKECIRALKNFDHEGPIEHAKYYTSLITTERHWTKEELLEAAEGVTVEMLEEFIPRFFSNLFIEGLIHGNTTKEIANRMVDTVKETLVAGQKLEPLQSTQFVRNRQICLRDGGSYRFEAENQTHTDSAVEVYLQTGLQGTRQNVLIELLAQILHEPYFTQLRTKEKLGYLVSSGVSRAHGVQGIVFILQSDSQPESVEGRIEEFLGQMRHELVEMTPEVFEKHKKALASKRMDQPRQLSMQAAKYWMEIETESYNFDRDRLEVAELDKLTKEDLIEFYEELIAQDAPSRKKLSVHVYSKKTKSDRKSNEASGHWETLPKVELIRDIANFKSAHQLYEITRPSMIVPP